MSHSIPQPEPPVKAKLSLDAASCVMALEQALCRSCDDVSAAAHDLNDLAREGVQPAVCLTAAAALGLALELVRKALQDISPLSVEASLLAEEVDLGATDEGPDASGFDLDSVPW